MKLIEMNISNFRAISGSVGGVPPVSIRFDNSHLIFLFGGNNNGKSSILSAYEYLVNPKQMAVISDFHAYDIKNNIEIEAVFKKETADDAIFQSKGFDKWVSHDGLIRFKKVWTSTESPGQKQTFDPVNKEYVDNGFGGIEAHFTFHAPTAIRIPAMDSPAALSKWLTDLMEKTVLKQLGEEEAAASQDILLRILDLQKKICGMEAVSGLNENVNTLFKKIFPALFIRIDIAEGQNFDLESALKKEFSVTIEDGYLRDKKQEITTQGHDVIRQAMFNILGVVKSKAYTEDWAKLEKKKYLLLFEEPEIYLHPESIRSLKDMLYELCSNSPFQILCASHSPILIDLSKPHSSLVRLVKNPSGASKSYQVDDNIFGRIDEEKQFLEMIQRFDPYVCEVFLPLMSLLLKGIQRQLSLGH